MAEQDQNRIKVIQAFAARVGSANDKKNETVTALSNIFQDLEKAGLSKKGFKFVMGLRKMEQADRNFLMREINDYSAALGLFDQGDMFLDGTDKVESAQKPPAPAAKRASDAWAWARVTSSLMSKNAPEVSVLARAKKCWASSTALTCLARKAVLSSLRDWLWRAWVMSVALIR